MKSNIKPQEVEVINAGKRLVRTNIVPHYLPIDESKITTVEVPNLDGEGTHLETVYPSQEIDYWTYDEKVEYKTCYALLSFGQYFDLNYKISMLQGYDLALPTERYAPICPRITAGETPLCVLELTVEVQEKCADLLEGVMLVDNGQWTLAEEQPTTIEATGLTTEQVDWTLNHTAATGTTVELIQLESEPRSEESDIAVEQLVSEGVTIITVE